MALDVAQADPALELFLRLFTRAGLARGRRAAGGAAGRDGQAARAVRSVPPSVRHFLAHAGRYRDTVDAVVRFLQGRDPGLALRIAGREFLPEGPRFAALAAASRTTPRRTRTRPLEWAFGALGLQDRAKHLASLYIDDLADVFRDGIDPRFELSPLRREAGRERHLVRRAGRGAGRAAHAGRPHPGRDHRRAAGRSTARICWG